MNGRVKLLMPICKRGLTESFYSLCKNLDWYPGFNQRLDKFWIAMLKENCPCLLWVSFTNPFSDFRNGIWKQAWSGPQSNLMKLRLNIFGNSNCHFNHPELKVMTN